MQTICDQPDHGLGNARGAGHAALPQTLNHAPELLSQLRALLVAPSCVNQQLVERRPGDRLALAGIGTALTGEANGIRAPRAAPAIAAPSSRRHATLPWLRRSPVPALASPALLPTPARSAPAGAACLRARPRARSLAAATSHLPAVERLPSALQFREASCVERSSRRVRRGHRGPAPRCPLADALSTSRPPPCTGSRRLASFGG